MKHEIKLTYDSMIALIQGKKLHIRTLTEEFVFLPPMEGVFVTHDQLAAMRFSDDLRILNLIKSVADHTQEVKDNG
jgi:ABC-type sugar transport system ATPase subunit